MRTLRPGVRLLAVVLAAALTGCAGTGGGPGSDLLSAGKFEEAVALLVKQVSDNPNDARGWRNLGIARLKGGDARAALSDLERAHLLAPRDAATLLFLGRAEEEAGELDRAANTYQAYLELKPNDAEVRTRLRETNLRKLRAEIAAAIQRERDISASRIPENTIAVMEFSNLTGSAELASLGKGLAAMVTGDLARVRRFQVVEREKIPILMNEISLGSSTVSVNPRATTTDAGTTRGMQERLAMIPSPSGSPYYRGTADGGETAAYAAAVRAFQEDNNLTVDGRMGPLTRAAIVKAYDAWLAGGRMSVPAMDQASVPRAGKLLGARLLVQGGFSGARDAGLRIDAGMTESTTGQSKGSGADAGGPLEQLFRMEKEIVFELLNALDIRLSDEEKDAIGRPPTDNIDAFIAWSEGLGHEDRGAFDLARQSYARAVELDPGFNLARQSRDAVSGTAEGFSRLEQSVFESSLAGGGGVSDDALQARLDRGTENLGWGVTPQRTGEGGLSGDQFNPIVAPVGAAGGSGTVVITGEIPQ